MKVTDGNLEKEANSMWRGGKFRAQRFGSVHSHILKLDASAFTSCLFLYPDVGFHQSWALEVCGSAV